MIVEKRKNNNNNNYHRPNIHDLFANNKNINTNTNTSTNINTVSCTTTTNIQKITQTLQWRNRYNQDEYYPINLDTTIPVDPVHHSNNKNNNNNNNDENSNRNNSKIIQTVSFKVRQEQRGEVENTFGTGGTVWPASVVLIKYMECLVQRGLLFSLPTRDVATDTTMISKKDVMIEKVQAPIIRVVDLGTGTGIAGISAAMFINAVATQQSSSSSSSSSSSLVVCTDYCKAVVKLARDNVRKVISDMTNIDNQTIKDERNNNNNDDRDYDNNKQQGFKIGTCNIHVQEYSWGDGSMGGGSAGQNQQKYDLILISDCVLPKLYPMEPLIDAIDELSGPYTLSLLTYERRWYPGERKGPGESSSSLSSSSLKDDISSKTELETTIKTEGYEPGRIFAELIRDRGFDLRIVPMEEQHSFYSVDDIEVWEVRRRLK